MTTPPWTDWFPEQRCKGCGDEHPGAGCKAQDNLFGSPSVPGNHLVSGTMEAQTEAAPAARQRCYPEPEPDKGASHDRT